MQLQPRHIWHATASKRFSIVFTTNINQIVSSAWQPKECFRNFFAFSISNACCNILADMRQICSHVHRRHHRWRTKSKHLSMPLSEGVASERLFTPPFCTAVANFPQIPVQHRYSGKDSAYMDAH